MKKLLALLLIVVLANGFMGCSSEDHNIEPNGGNGRTNKDTRDQDYFTVYQFIWRSFYTYYYWNSNIPERLNLYQFNKPIELFNYFKNPDDRFSALLNNYSETYSYFNNEFVTAGIVYSLFTDKYNKDNVVAVVDLVYPGSPAEAAGIKRGQVIKAVNGTTFTRNNYQDLLSNNSFSVTYTLLTVNENTMELEYDGEEFTSPTITKTKMDVDPILQVSTHHINGHNIGYFLYESFDDNTQGLITAMEKLKAENITDLVLDLRFNGGGYINTLDTLVSMIVPPGNEGKLFINTDMNDNLTQAYRKRNVNLGDYFINMPVNLNINKLYVITSKNTASASEELISGLKPYMDVVMIGDTTYGKYTTNFLLNNDEDEGKDPDGIDHSEWAVYLVVGCCKNAAGEMNFKNGFVPDYYIKDLHIGELGDPEEPLFAKAISLILGDDLPVLAKRGKPQIKNDMQYITTVGKPDITKGLLMR